MSWTVELSAKANKRKERLPHEIRARLLSLLISMEDTGPIQPDMRHFGKLKGRGETYHCHLKAGRPTYVAVWEVRDKTIRLIEVIYVGTHEDAPY